MTPTARKLAQAFVEPTSDDPEAVSALAVARARLDDARGLVALRRMRLFELAGDLPERREVAQRLHGSTQFYNPAKERCTVRTADGDPAPVSDAEWLVLVVERGGERRPAAERWWRHETGRRIAAREGVAWALTFDPPDTAGEHAESLAVTRDRGHGLFCNPHYEQWRIVRGRPPIGWIGSRASGRARGGRRS